MMMRSVLIAAAALLAGCASVGQTSSGLHDAFGRYSETLAAGDIVAKRSEFFTPTMLNGVNIQAENDLFDLKVGHYVRQERSHYETVKQDRGCLTVNGYENKNANPVSLFLEYRKINGVWLIDSTYVYLQAKNVFTGFVEKALCPNEAQDGIARRFDKGR